MAIAFVILSRIKTDDEPESFLATFLGESVIKALDVFKSYVDAQKPGNFTLFIDEGGGDYHEVTQTYK